MKNSGRGGGILAELGVTPVINGGGPNTMHSGSRPLPEVVEAMEAMAPVFVQMDEWLIAAGREIAQLIGAPAATVTSGASGGLVVQTAAAVSRGDPELISRLPLTDGLAQRVDHSKDPTIRLRPPLSCRGRAFRRDWRPEWLHSRTGGSSHHGQDRGHHRSGIRTA